MSWYGPHGIGLSIEIYVQSTETFDHYCGHHTRAKYHKNRNRANFLILNPKSFVSVRLLFFRQFNDKVLRAIAKNTHVEMRPNTGISNQKWRWEGDHLRNIGYEQVLDIYIKQEDGSTIGIWTLHGGVNQRWTEAHESRSSFHLFGLIRFILRL